MKQYAPAIVFMFLGTITVGLIVRHVMRASQFAPEQAAASPADRPDKATAPATASAPAAAEGGLKLPPTLKVQADKLLLFRDGQWWTLAQFASPQELKDISDFKASPDGKYLLIWHDRPRPRKVSIFDLTTLKRVSQFTPGAAGELRWTAADTMIHTWAIDKAREYRVYDVQGKKLQTGKFPALDVSPGGTWLVKYAPHPAPGDSLHVLDLRSLKEIPVEQAKEIASVSDVNWPSGDDSMEVSFHDLQGKTRTTVVLLPKQLP